MRWPLSSSTIRAARACSRAPPPTSWPTSRGTSTPAASSPTIVGSTTRAAARALARYWPRSSAELDGVLARHRDEEVLRITTMALLEELGALCLESLTIVLDQLGSRLARIAQSCLKGGQVLFGTPNTLGEENSGWNEAQLAFLLSRRGEFNKRIRAPRQQERRVRSG